MLISGATTSLNSIPILGMEVVDLAISLAYDVIVRLSSSSCELRTFGIFNSFTYFISFYAMFYVVLVDFLPHFAQSIRNIDQDRPL